jgi:hypothetical protein
VDGQAVAHIRETLMQFAPLLLGALLSVAVLLPFVWRAWKRWGDGMGYAVVGASVPVLLAFLVSFKVMLFDERYLIAAAPFLYMVVAAAMDDVLRWRRGSPPAWQSCSGVAAIGLYSVLLLVSLYNYFFAERFGREQWREAVAYVESRSSGKMAVVFDPDFLHYAYDYYEKRSLPYFSVTDSSTPGMPVSPAAIHSQVAGYDSVWLIRSHSDSAAVQDAFKGMFLEDSRRVFPKGDGIEVSHFRTDQR